MFLIEAVLTRQATEAELQDRSLNRMLTKLEEW